MCDVKFIPGPLHPDLFGGDTPVMLPCDDPLNEFSVEVCWPSGEVVECRRLIISACTHEEAALHVLGQTRMSTSPHAEVVDVQYLPQDHESESWIDPGETGS
jgi:hypothetical protein